MSSEEKRAESRSEAGATTRETTWLTADELETWHELSLLVAKLPAALGAQLHRDADLSFMEYYVLAALSDQPDHALRMSRLALIANSELSRLSHLVRRLEGRGLLRREPDALDGRFTNAILTVEGLDYLVEVAPSHVATVRELVFDGLSGTEQHALRKAVRVINERLGGDC